MREVLKIHPWSKQREIAEGIWGEKRKASVRSCHGVGKTFIAANLGLTFLYTNKDSILITTAPAARTVANQIWREIRQRVRICNLPGRPLTTRLELADKWYGIGISTDDTDKFQGFHAKKLLMIFDEAAGVDQAIYDAAEGILTNRGSHQLLIGNPTSIAGKFYDSHHKLRSFWEPIHIDAFGSPNFTNEKRELPQEILDELVDPEWAEARAIEWGEESPLYQVRVRGNFVNQGESSLISLAWLNDVKTYEPQPSKDEPVVLGADIARQGNCETAIYIKKDQRILHYEAWRKDDLNYTANRITAKGQEYGTHFYKIDANGMGAGVIDILKANQQLRPEQIVSIQAGAAASEGNELRFGRFRDEIWWNLRTLLQARAIGPLDDEKTISQLVTVQYSYDKKGRIIIEDKRELQGRSLPSPDRADALALAFAPDPPIEKSRKVIGL